MVNDERVSKDTSQAAEPSVGEPEGEEAIAAERAASEEPSSEKLALMLEDARTKADEHWDALLRAKAEMDNLRKRASRDVENAHKFGIERFLGELLPVKDSLELGLSAAGDEQVDVAKLREGMELTLKMLSTAMEKFGVEQVDPEGEKFDPERHQAMTMHETDSVEPGTVVSVIQKGYVLNDRLVRPALVIVAKEIHAG
jgi:molecular chaperone GrpE